MPNEDIPLSPVEIREQWYQARVVNAHDLLFAPVNYRIMTARQAADRALAKLLITGWCR